MRGFLVQVSVKSQNERKSRENCYEQKKVLSEDPGVFASFGFIACALMQHIIFAQTMSTYHFIFVTPAKTKTIELRKLASGNLNTKG